LTTLAASRRRITAAAAAAAAADDDQDEDDDDDICRRQQTTHAACRPTEQGRSRLLKSVQAMAGPARPPTTDYDPAEDDLGQCRSTATASATTYSHLLSTKFGVMMHAERVRIVRGCLKNSVSKFKMADSCHLENRKSQYLTTMPNERIFTVKIFKPPRDTFCVIVPNFLQIGAEISHFLRFSSEMRKFTRWSS